MTSTQAAAPVADDHAAEPGGKSEEDKKSEEEEEDPGLERGRLDNRGSNRSRASTDVALMLQEHDVDTTAFGRGEAKSLKRLIDEVKEGSAQLTIDATRHKNLMRMVDVVLVRVAYDGDRLRGKQFLVMVHEKLKDGREKKNMNRMAGSKRKNGESTEQTVDRIMREDIGKISDCVTIDTKNSEVFEETEESLSYPGVRTRYRKQIVEAIVTGGDDAIRRLGVKEGEYHWEGAKGVKIYEWLNTQEAEIKDPPVRLWARLEADDDDSASEPELEDEPPRIPIVRRYGVSAEAAGAWNQQKAFFVKQSIHKNAEQMLGLLKALKSCPFFSSLDDEALKEIGDYMPIETFHDKDYIVKQGDSGDAAFAILSGMADCYHRESEDGDDDDRGTFVREMAEGRFFGEMGMLWSVPRTRSVCARGVCVVAKLSREAYLNMVMRYERKQREQREQCLRRVKMLERLSDEEMAQIADTLERRVYEAGQVIIPQGAPGHEMFVVLQGVCAASIATGTDKGKIDVQEHRRYGPGDLFGERALLKRVRRAATVTAITKAELLCLHRRKFERMLGSLDSLQGKKYQTDPRKIVADFFLPGTSAGPRGVRTGNKECGPEQTEWFAVYRPTSRDAINKMLNGVAVGKGLNVKGKSAKRNRLSGFVPFLQISNNRHKNQIEDAPSDSRFKMFFLSTVSRQSAINHLEQLLAPEEGLEIDDRHIYLLDDWPEVHGIDLPEAVVREAFIIRPDISFLLGWETGRQSEPDFMNMNLHCVRDSRKPDVCLYQVDPENPVNPHGVVIAYAEEFVKPVVSDFDTFVVGSTNFNYSSPPEEQVELANWSLEQARKILENPRGSQWNSRWLELIRDVRPPKQPEFGNGDPVSYRLTEAVIESTLSIGAVRHGAECFNFFFPQDFDEEYLVIWEKFPDKPWEYKTEEELQVFLMERIEEGFVFPMNPVWPTRSPGWYEVFDKLRKSPDPFSKAAFNGWFVECGLADKIEALHTEFPNGFIIDEECETPVASVGEKRASQFQDLDECERVDLGEYMYLAKKPGPDGRPSSKDRGKTASNQGLSVIQESPSGYAGKGGAVPFVAVGREQDTVILSCFSTLDAEEDRDMTRGAFRKLLLAEQAKLTGEQRSRLKWSEGSVRTLRTSEGMLLYCLVTSARAYPDQLVQQLLGDLLAEVQRLDGVEPSALADGKPQPQIREFVSALPRRCVWHVWLLVPGNMRSKD